MQLTIRPLEDVQTVNSWRPATELVVSTGDPLEIVFQLVYAKNPCGGDEVRRYMPATGATLTLVLDNLDNAKKVTKVATQPFSSDGSIWRVALTAQDTAKLAGTVTWLFTLTEGTRVVTGRLQAAMAVK